VESISVDVVGDVSEVRYVGVFKIKTRLSHRDSLRKDQIRRELIGTHSESVSNQAFSIAEAFSIISAHVVDAPQWWIAAGNGMDLEDNNVVEKVLKEIEGAKKIDVDARKAKTATDKKSLEKELNEV